MAQYDTRGMIRQFNLAFDRPVNLAPTDISVSERELLGKLLLEETLEFCVKGLGLAVSVAVHPTIGNDYVQVGHVEGALLDHIECADGLGDVNVVAHFCAHWLGYNLDAVTKEINDSNMSKLDDDGNPIINRCGVEPFTGHDCEIDGGARCVLIDPAKPAGKILKGPNFRKPDIAGVIHSHPWNS